MLYDLETSARSQLRSPMTTILTRCAWPRSGVAAIAYGSLQTLNASGRRASRMDAVEPMTTYEIKDREKTGSENYSPWADIAPSWT